MSVSMLVVIICLKLMENLEMKVSRLMGKVVVLLFEISMSVNRSLFYDVVNMKLSVVVIFGRVKGRMICWKVMNCVVLLIIVVFLRFFGMLLKKDCIRKVVKGMLKVV